ncbi:PfkB family carbohydrate kinase [Microbacterium sp. GXS0129]|uniref:PfkB family carbohydrate kinase n=1 Tax=Microbacterium sp. GXS0129 TaxID=3377836 RepID=UPI00383BD22F
MTQGLGTVTGIVVPGDGRGRVLGFPTANLAVGSEELPSDGVYAAWVSVDGGDRIGASASIGSNPTFAGERARRIEVHLHDVELDLYGRSVSVTLVRRLRATLRFPHVDELIAQTHRDIADARRALAEVGGGAVAGVEFGGRAAMAVDEDAVVQPGERAETESGERVMAELGGSAVAEPGRRTRAESEGRTAAEPCRRAATESGGRAVATFRDDSATESGERAVGEPDGHGVAEAGECAVVPGARVAVVGSANLDIVVRVERPPAVGETLLGAAGGRFPGGKGLNQATAAARSGARVEFCTAVGHDDAGEQLTRALVAAGVGVDHVQTVGEPTGVAHILSYPDGDNSIAVAAGANGALTGADAAVAVADAAVVLVQLEVPLDVVRAALAAGSHAVRILNAAPAHEEARELLHLVDILVVNETECEALGGVDALAADGVTLVVTLGGAGVRVHPRGAEVFHVPAFAIDPVDTTGAGDAFCGALAASLARGFDLEHAVRRANAAGAIAACSVGAAAYRISASALDEVLATGIVPA